MVKEKTTMDEVAKLKSELEDLKIVIKRHEMKIVQFDTALQTAMIQLAHLTRKVVVEPALKEKII